MTPHAFEDLVQPYRRELAAYCYRMLGSLADAEDQVQETLLSAWRGIDGFEGRASLRSWLYRIATNRCLDAIRRRPRRELPTERGAPADPHAALGAPDSEILWLEPAPASLWEGVPASPEASVSARESVRLAFIVALQHLPATQRAALILREVVGWSAAEVAALLDTTVPAVNSALQRARAALDGKQLFAEAQGAAPRPAPPDEALIARYIAAWEAGDVTALAQLLHEGVIASMPPYGVWFRGRAALAAFLGPRIAPPHAKRIVRVAGADDVLLAAYRPAADGAYEAHSVQVARFEGGLVVELHAFLEPSLLPRFGLPPRVPR